MMEKTQKGEDSMCELGLEAAYNRTALIIKFGPIVSWYTIKELPTPSLSLDA